MKFLRKLVTMAVLEGGADAMIFHAAWLYLLNIDESAEVLLLLLQAFAKTHDISNSLQEPILHKMLLLGESVDINTLLQKITAVAVFFNSYTITEIIKIHDDLFERTFLPQMELFLRQLEQALDGGSPAGNGAAQSTFENNARFLALMVQEKLQTYRGPVRRCGDGYLRNNLSHGEWRQELTSQVCLELPHPAGVRGYSRRAHASSVQP
ncbi:hypothetical protein HF325_002653 [Metschnikowia pulcherrima]|uniref:Uncharacterized protein n=1 Tax=Metschnikowia pulcherrima TaxID=27326 RepID=A0A8H7GU19_9ASCO|nr:hypothetical protein HF325_002653 [Metschnikowia pulcherrima]